MPTPSACSWWNSIWPSEACSLALGQQQIQNSVPANAAAANAIAIANGQPPPYDIPFIQSVANQQAAAFAGDNATIFNSAPSLTDPSTWAWYYWAAGALGLFLLVKR